MLGKKIYIRSSHDFVLEGTEGTHSTKQSENKYFAPAKCLIQIHILVFRFVTFFSLSDGCFGKVKEALLSLH